MNDEIEPQDTVVSLAKARTLKEANFTDAEEATQEELLKQGVDAFNEFAKASSGFISILFSKEDGSPTVVTSGDLSDIIRILGVLEFMKSEFLNESVVYNLSEEDFEFNND